MTQISTFLIVDLLVYLVLFAICTASAVKNSNSLLDVLSGKGSMVQINFRHIYSILLLIILLFWHSGIDPSGTEPFKIIKGYFNWVVAGLALMVLYISTSAKITGNNEQHPPYSTLHVYLYFLLRILYLVLYEIYFRFLLLNSISDSFNSLTAILLTSLLYFIIHLFNRRSEFFSSLPFGALLAWLSFETRSVYPAIILHLLLSVPFEFRLFYHLNSPHHGKDFFNRSNRLHW